jgi:hypothetical protein
MLHTDCHAPSFLRKAPNGFIMMEAQQQATCTSGPSFPSHRPELSAKHYQHTHTPINTSCKNRKMEEEEMPKREWLVPGRLI